MMEKIIKAAVDRGASDLHIKAGDVFRARIHGELVALTKQKLTPEQTRAIALHLMSNEDDKARIDKILDYDCSWAATDIGRFRVNLMKQRGSFSIIMRVIPWEVPTFEQLGLPPVLARIASAERGMILVTGVTGSGKSSTMAALIKYINERENRHILTLENPIEFLHRDVKSSVTQREVGWDTSDFKMGLRAALRQDPDVIMIGEMRDAETVDTAIKAAETGHLLMSTLHTPDAQSTILRIVAMFPPEEQDIIRIRLAESLYAVVSQRLLPKKTGKGRAVAAEIMINTPSIKDLILEGTRIGEIRDFIAGGREQYGMQTFDQCLTELVSAGEVTFEVAKAAATNPSDFELQMKMFSQSVTEEPAEPAPSEPEPAMAELDGLQTGTLDFM
ncbi:MAG TPA: type IV pilus twitching motility protein PilT [Gemmatimonadaceae bacterium]|jgi:twitching motility protein PilT|nr:type IV pilus twitching motility protein PilT [Gemmatimonadaceae bacterium]